MLIFSVGTASLLLINDIQLSSNELQEGAKPRISSANNWLLYGLSSVPFSHSVMSYSLRPHESQHAGLPVHHQLPEFTQAHVHQVRDAISHLILCHPLFLLPPIPPSIRVFPMSQLFAWGGQSIGVTALASILPMNTQDWSSLEWTGWISLQSKRLSRAFSNTTVQKHQFFSAQLSSQSNSHIHTWPLGKP